jgi:hypothetical protein
MCLVFIIHLIMHGKHYKILHIRTFHVLIDKQLMKNVVSLPLA